MSYFAFFLVLLGALAQVDGQCNDLIQQYFECQHLKMKPIRSDILLGKSVEKFVPDDSIPENQLTDEFFEQRIGHLDLDGAMDLFQTIYNLTDNCSTELCKCVSSANSDVLNWYGRIFRNAQLFPQFKAIVAEFNQKYPPENQLSFNLQFLNLPSIYKFCRRYDYSSFKINNFEQTQKCMIPKSYSLLSTLECNWNLYQDAHVRYVIQGNISALTGRQQAHLAVCAVRITGVSSCDVETQRLFIINILTQFSEDVWLRIADLKTYSDNLMAKVASYSPRFFFNQTSVMLSSSAPDEQNLQVGSLKNGLQLCPIAQNADVVLFSSPDLNLTVEWYTNELDQIRFKLVNVSLKYDEDFLFTRSFELHPGGMPILDSTYRDPKEPFDKIWIRIIDQSSAYQRAVSIFDFKNNIQMSATLGIVSLNAPSTLMITGTGLLVESCAGEAASDIVRKKRSLNDRNCQDSCRFWQDSNFFMFQVCLHKCGL